MKIELDTENFDREIDRIREEYENKGFQYAEKANENGAKICFDLSNDIETARRIFWSYVENEGKIDPNNL